MTDCCPFKIRHFYQSCSSQIMQKHLPESASSSYFLATVISAMPPWEKNQNNLLDFHINENAREDKEAPFISSFIFHQPMSGQVRNVRSTCRQVKEIGNLFFANFPKGLEFLLVIVMTKMIRMKSQKSSTKTQ